MTTILAGRFDEALIFTAHVHTGQLRKGTTIPYIAHLLSVASLVITHGGGEDEAIAALLHDAGEDQGGKPTLAIIRARFGDRVAEIVDGCTDTYEAKKPAWRERKERYLQHLESASSSVKLVAAADKMDNVTSIIRDYRTEGAAIWTRFNAGRDDQRWFYRACVTAMQSGPTSLVRELDAAVQQLEHL